MTRGKASWQYGRFEMRGRIDVRPGMWPAFWTLGDEGGWPAGGEIDVMEYYRGTLLANAAWANRRRLAKWDDSRTPLEELGGDQWADKFHDWRMDWDDRPHRALRRRPATQRRSTSPRRSTKRPTATIRSAQPHHMLLSLAIGGMNGGDPGDTEFPARFEIDYVRVYQK